MKVFFLVQDRKEAAARARVVDLLPELRRFGWEGALLELPSSRRGRGSLFSELGSADLVCLQRRLMNRWDASRLRRNARILAYDFDDAMPFRDSAAGAGLSRTRARRFRYLVSRADLVVAGNPVLEDLARESGAAFTVVVPTGISLGDYPFRSSGLSGARFRVGWIGSGSTLPYLEGLGGAFEGLSAKLPRLEVAVMADRAPRWGSVEVDFHRWSREGEISFLHSLDVGVAPLTEDSWARGKCGFRMLKYAASGVPMVASPVGIQAELIEDRVSGRLVEGVLDWIEALLDMERFPERARQYTVLARRFVEGRFSLPSVAERLGLAFRKTVERKMDGA